MTRSTLFLIVKYSIFVNWTLTGFWIIYNSTDYSMNAQVISERISTDYYSDSVEKASVVYGLIAWTIFTSFMSFFGLVGVCYENIFLTLGLGVSYLAYTLFDIIFNACLGVPFGVFLIIMYILLFANTASLFFLCFMIRHSSVSSSERGSNFDGSRGGI